MFVFVTDASRVIHITNQAANVKLFDYCQTKQAEWEREREATSPPVSSHKLAANFDIGREKKDPEERFCAVPAVKAGSKWIAVKLSRLSQALMQR